MTYVVECENCSRTGKRGNGVRKYVDDAPLGKRYLYLCFPCFQKLKKLHVHLVDAVEVKNGS